MSNICLGAQSPLLAISQYICLTFFKLEIPLKFKNYWELQKLLCIWIMKIFYLFSCWVMSDSVILWTAAQEASLSIINSQSLLKLMSSSGWWHPTISSSVIHFSSCLQLFPAAGSFPVSQFFTLGGKSIGASVSALVILMNIQVWFLLRLIILISLQSKELSRVFSNNTVEKYQFFFWDFSEVLHFRLFCWQWGLFHLF